MTLVSVLVATLLLLEPRDAAVVSVTYVEVPAAVVEATWYPWTGEAPVVMAARAAIRAPDRMVIRVDAGQRGIVVFRARNGSYLIDGPFVSHRDTTRRVEPVWRRTIHGFAPAEAAGTMPAVDWMAADPRVGDRWPRCGWRDSQQWDCWGVDLSQSGIVSADDGGGVWWAAVNGGSAEPVMRKSRWARMLIVHREGGLPPANLQAVAMRVAVASPTRPNAIRVRKAPLGDSPAVPLGPAVWIAGGVVPEDSWMEVRADDSAPVYLPLADLSAGPRAAPVLVRLDEERVIDGAIRGPAGQPIAGAVIAVSRLVDPPEHGKDRDRKLRRVSEFEVRADAEGSFTLRGLGSERYEVLAWHPQFGRVAHLVDTAERHLDLRIRAAATATGRVLVGGKPAPGVDVISQPDPHDFMEADDVVEVKGGDGKTGPDGRFMVALAPAGGGELRIGGGVSPGTRISLPRGTPASIDLGDIELGTSISVRLVLDQDSECELRAVGPVGRLGLRLVQTTRIGPGLFEVTLPESGTWSFVQVCGEEDRPLIPATVQITSRTKDVQLSVR